MALRPNIRGFAAKKARQAARAAEQRAVTAPVRPLAAKPARPLAAKPTPRPALPAPEPRLALPAPDPAAQLPPLASKPRGGQWWPEQLAPVNNPDVVARRYAESSRFAGFTPALDGDLGLDTSTTPEQDWLAKSLARYYKNEFGAPDDPLRALAEQGLHYDADMTPDKWRDTVNEYLMEDPIGPFVVPGQQFYDPRTVEVAPWLAKAPVTDNIYGIRQGGLDLGHFEDELYNALNPEESGLPAELALRPESLSRMSFPQAVERVGRINQFRVKQMEEQQLSALNNPAIQTFKDYPEAGYRWVELRTPDLGDDLAGYRIEEQPGIFLNGPGHVVFDPKGVEMGAEMSRERALRNIQADAYRRDLADALKFEGDTMGHCVGGYCDDVLSGRSRIFSLRDAKGQPHVTIETAPGATKLGPLPETKLRDEYPELYSVYASGYSQAPSSEINLGGGFAGWLKRNRPDLAEQYADLVEPQQDIIQIKGKANRAPVDDYLPYVQDFVKSGTWGEVGDFRNTGLVKLPDGRYITQQQLDEVANSPAAAQLMGGNVEAARKNLAQWNLNTFNDEDWRQVGPLFEGYAVGGRVDASRCFSRNPLSVR